MIVYYVATEEKPQDLSKLKFYMDANEARDATLHGPGYVYEFEVNDKCDTQSFDMDTIMLFRKDKSTGELSFCASGTWIQLHEIMNLPFTYDFESKSSVFVAMSLRYFNATYRITRKEAGQPQKPTPTQPANPTCQPQSQPANPVCQPIGSTKNQATFEQVEDNLGGSKEQPISTQKQPQANPVPTLSQPQQSQSAVGGKPVQEAPGNEVKVVSWFKPVATPSQPQEAGSTQPSEPIDLPQEAGSSQPNEAIDDNVLDELFGA